MAAQARHNALQAAVVGPGVDAMRLHVAVLVLAGCVPVEPWPSSAGVPHEDLRSQIGDDTLDLSPVRDTSLLLTSAIANAGLAEISVHD